MDLIRNYFPRKAANGNLRINIYRGQVDTNNVMINVNGIGSGTNGVNYGANDVGNGINGAEVSLNKKQTQIEKLLQIIEKNPSATQAYYAEKMGISKRTYGAGVIGGKQHEKRRIQKTVISGMEKYA